MSQKVEYEIDRWHEGAGEEGQELHEFLGWTFEQYVAYMKDGTVPEVDSWWHTWTGTLEDGTTCTVTLGPTVMSPDDVGQDGAGIPIRERTFPFSLVTDKPGPEMTYLASFHHDPEDHEIEALREEREQ